MNELDLRQYVLILKKRMKLIIALPLLSLVITAIYSYWHVTPPQYQANTTLLINQPATYASSSDVNSMMVNIQSSQALINTYTQILKSRTVEKAVISDLNLPMSAGQLSGMVSVHAPKQSQVVRITVTSSSVQLSVKLANGMATAFQQQVSKIMNIQNVQIIDKAVVPSHVVAIKTNHQRKIAIAVALGFVISVALAFLLEYLDTRIQTEEDVHRYLSLPVLGSISDVGGDI